MDLLHYGLPFIKTELTCEWVAIKDNTCIIMPTISPFGLDGNHMGDDCFKMLNLLEISSNIKILSPFDIKGKGRSKIFSPFEIHYAIHAPPEYM